MFETITLIIAILSFLMAGADWLYSRLKKEVDYEHRFTELEGKVKSKTQQDLDNEHRFTELETKTNLFWHTVETKMTEFVHSPHTPDIDPLLEKMATKNLTTDEAKDLLYQLECALRDHLYAGEKVLAVIFITARLEEMIRDCEYKQVTVCEGVKVTVPER